MAQRDLVLLVESRARELCPAGWSVHTVSSEDGDVAVYLIPPPAKVRAIEIGKDGSLGWIVLDYQAGTQEGGDLQDLDEVRRKIRQWLKEPMP